MMIAIALVVIFLAVLLNWLSKKYVFKNLTYQRGFSKHVVEPDEDFDFNVTIENKKLLPVSFLQIFEPFPSPFKPSGHVKEGRLSTLFSEATLTLLPMQRVTRAYHFRCSDRGRFVVGEYRLTGGDVLGISAAEKCQAQPAEIITLPRPADLEHELSPYGDYCGDFSVKRWIIDDPVLTIGVREYTGVEPLKTIHWPSSLKSGSLMVKKFDYTTDNTVLILLNTECGKQEEQVERCLSIVRSVVDGLEESGIPYGFATNGAIGGDFDEKPCAVTGLGAPHYRLILEALGRINYDVRRPFDEFLADQADTARNFASVLVITPKVFEYYAEAINMLSSKVQGATVIALESDCFGLLDDNIAKYTESGQGV